MQIILRSVAIKTRFRGLFLLLQNFRHIVFRLNCILASYRASLLEWCTCAGLRSEWCPCTGLHICIGLHEDLLFDFWTEHLSY